MGNTPIVYGNILSFGSFDDRKDMTEALEFYKPDIIILDAELLPPIHIRKFKLFLKIRKYKGQVIIKRLYVHYIPLF